MAGAMYCLCSIYSEQYSCHQTGQHGWLQQKHQFLFNKAFIFLNFSYIKLQHLLTLNQTKLYYVLHAEYLGYQNAAKAREPASTSSSASAACSPPALSSWVQLVLNRLLSFRYFSASAWKALFFIYSCLSSSPCSLSNVCFPFNPYLIHFSFHFIHIFSDFLLLIGGYVTSRPAKALHFSPN